MPGYDVEWIAKPDRSYLCPICEWLLKDPIQTDGGTRFCRSCFEQRGRGLTLGTNQRYYEDKATRNEILAMKVKCKGCSWQGQLQKLEDHSCSAITEASSANTTDKLATTAQRYHRVKFCFSACTAGPRNHIFPYHDKAEEIKFLDATELWKFWEEETNVIQREKEAVVMLDLRIQNLEQAMEDKGRQIKSQEHKILVLEETVKAKDWLISCLQVEACGLQQTCQTLGSTLQQVSENGKKCAKATATTASTLKRFIPQVMAIISMGERHSQHVTAQPVCMTDDKPTILLTQKSGSQGLRIVEDHVVVPSKTPEAENLLALTTSEGNIVEGMVWGDIARQTPGMSLLLITKSTLSAYGVMAIIRIWIPVRQGVLPTFQFVTHASPKFVKV